jgi:hypothetical protein
MILRFPGKTNPGALTYGLRLVKWLDGRALASASWTIPNNDGELVKVVDAIDADASVAFAKFSGGTIGKEYRLDCLVMAEDGETERFSAFLRILPFKPQ